MAFFFFFFFGLIWKVGMKILEVSGSENKETLSLTWANFYLSNASNLLQLVLQVIYWPIATCENVEITKPNF